MAAGFPNGKQPEFPIALHWDSEVIYCTNLGLWVVSSLPSLCDETNDRGRVRFRRGQTLFGDKKAYTTAAKTNHLISQTFAPSVAV